MAALSEGLSLASTQLGPLKLANARLRPVRSERASRGAGILGGARPSEWHGLAVWPQPTLDACV